MMDIKDKFVDFISHLSDEEIDEQLNNIFQWAQMYQSLLENEKKVRDSRDSEDIYDSGDVSDDIITPQPYMSSGIDYYYIQAFQEKLRHTAEKDIQESLDKLKRINLDELNDEERELLEYEIDACELYLHDIRKDAEENQLCTKCGCILPLNAKFCIKCGAKV